MKTTRKILWGVSALLIGLIVLAAGCGAPIGANTPFYSQTKEVAPYVTETARSVESKAATWNWGSPLYEIYNMLKDGAGDDTVGISNMWKALYQAGSFYEELKASSSDFDNLTTVSPTWSDADGGASANADDFVAMQYQGGTVDTTNDRSFAYRVDGDTEYGLITWVVDQGTVTTEDDEYGLMQGSFNEVTGDVTLNMVAFVEMATTNPDYYTVRYHITGNMNTHQFTAKLIKFNGGAYRGTIVGAGKNTGDADYMVFKLSDNEGRTDAGYKFEANLDETEMQAMDDAGTAWASLTDDPDGYKATIDAQTPFDNAELSTDVPKALTDFTNSNILTFP